MCVRVAGFGSLLNGWRWAVELYLFLTKLLNASIKCTFVIATLI